MKPDFEFDVVSSELPVAIVAVAFAANAFAKPAVIVAASVAVTAAAIVAVTAAAIALVLMDPVDLDLLGLKAVLNAASLHLDFATLRPWEPAVLRWVLCLERCLVRCCEDPWLQRCRPM